MNSRSLHASIPPASDRWRSIPFWAGSAILGFGLLGILAWTWAQPLVLSFWPDLLGTKINTFVCFFFLGGALLLIERRERWAQVASCVLVFPPVLIGLLTLAEHLLSHDLKIDQLLVTDRFNPAPGGRISLLTTLSFLAVCTSFFLLQYGGRIGAAQVLALISALVALLQIVGHVYRVPFFYSINASSSSTVQTAAALLLLSIGALYIRPEQGFMSTISGSAGGSAMARRLIPTAAAAVLLLGLLRLAGAYLRLFSMDQGLALAMLGLSLTWVALIWFNASLLNRAEELHQITERERLESEMRFRRLADSNMLGVFFFDLSGTIFEANDYFLKAVGYTHADVRAGRVSWKTLTPPDCAEMDERKAREFIETGACTAYEKRYVHKNGSLIHVLIGAASFQEKPDSGIAYVLDLSALKRAELEAGRRAEELERSNSDLEQFAYVASHDLQEPLRMVSSFTQLLQQRYKNKLDADADEYIFYAVDGAKRMQGLIQDLLEYSRLSTRKNAFARIPLDAALDLALGNLRKQIGDAGGTIERLQLPIVYGDLTQLSQLFQNLVGNALKYRGTEPPRIQIGATARDGQWQYFVRDNGIGIKPEYHERIFVIFQRLHSKGEYPGTGIGLALCKKIVERHGGRIWVESPGTSGSAFYFTLNADAARSEQNPRGLLDGKEVKP
jgi:PAS domain S-box-containing protein